VGQSYVPHLAYWANKEYIASKLCENKDRPEMKCEGKCHLTKKVKEQQERNSESEMPAKQMVEGVPHLPTPSLQRFFCTCGSDVYLNISDELSERHAWSMFHPPQG
jgi:hypothetical protein